MNKQYTNQAFFFAFIFKKEEKNKDICSKSEQTDTNLPDTSKDSLSIGVLPCMA